MPQASLLSPPLFEVGHGHGTPFLGICSGFLTIVLFWGEGGAHAEFPKACVWRGVCFSSRDPWLCPTPALTRVQMFTGSLPPTPPSAARRPQRKKHKKRERQRHSWRHSPPAHSRSFKKKEKKKEKESEGGKKENCKPRKLFRETYLKLAGPDQHTPPPDPSPLPVIPCLECVCVFTPTPLRAAPCPALHGIGFQGLFQTTANVTEGPALKPWAQAPLT